jgi:hypothetical protein
MSNLIPNLDGDWKMSIDGEGASKSAICTLIQVGDTLTGTFRGPVGNLAVTGAVTNHRDMAFSAKFIMGDLRFLGTVNGSTMIGVVKLIDEQNS